MYVRVVKQFVWKMYNNCRCHYYYYYY